MKPARVYYYVGSFGAPVSFSSDEQGMPREFMGVYIFFRKLHQILFYTGFGNKIW